jgi:protease-4
MVFALVLLALLFLSVMCNLAALAGSLAHGRPLRYARAGGPRIDEVILEDKDSVNKVAVVPVEGLITGRVIDQGGYSMVDVIKAELKRAQEDDRVKVVILKVDSPGGEVLASDEIYRALAQFQQKQPGKPVVVSMGDLAASGGYYVASPCRWIVANELTITGSIGVVLHTWNYRGLMDKVGLRPEVYKSGKYKDMLSGEREPSEITPEERQMLKGFVDETFARFKSVVAQGRQWAHQQNKDAGVALSADWEDYADGRVLSGREALNHGFVDQLGNFDEAVKASKKIAGVSTANLVEYRQRYDLSDLFRLFGKSQSKTVKLDLGLELPKLRAGQAYYLPPGLAQ